MSAKPSRMMSRRRARAIIEEFFASVGDMSTEERVRRFVRYDDGSGMPVLEQAHGQHVGVDEAANVGASPRDGIVEWEELRDEYSGAEYVRTVLCRHMSSGLIITMMILPPPRTPGLRAQLEHGLRWLAPVSRARRFPDVVL